MNLRRVAMLAAVLAVAGVLLDKPPVLLLAASLAVAGLVAWLAAVRG